MNNEHHSLLHGDLDEDDLLPGNVYVKDEHPFLRHGGVDEDDQPGIDQLHSEERQQALACLLLVQQAV